MSAIANPKRDAELLHGERKYLSLSSCIHLPASFSASAASLVLDSLEMWQSKGLGAGMRAAICRRQGRNPLWQPDPGGQWAAGARFASTPLLLWGEEGWRDAGAPFVFHLFPFTELLCLCLPISSMLSCCNKTYLLPGVLGFDLRAHTPHGEKPCTSYDTGVC